jgi:hypothetical protein
LLFFGLALVLGALGLAVPGAHAAPATLIPGVSNYHVAAPSGNHCLNPASQRLGAGVSLGPCGRYYWVLVRVRNGCDQLRNPGGRLALIQTRSAKGALGSPRDLHDSCFFIADNFVDRADFLDELHFANKYLAWYVSGRGGSVSFVPRSLDNVGHHTQWNSYF